MGRILAIDYGAKRSGIAVSDPLRIIASALTTVATPELMQYLQQYVAAESVDTIVVGEPLHTDGQPMPITAAIYTFVKKLKEQFPKMEVVLQDERYSSKEASQIILKSGLKKKKRRDKALVDKVSASLILKEYMENHIW